MPALQRAGYDVTYDEFVGGHTVPARVQRDAAAWLEEAGEAMTYSAGTSCVVGNA